MLPSSFLQDLPEWNWVGQVMDQAYWSRGDWGNRFGRDLKTSGDDFAVGACATIQRILESFNLTLKEFHEVLAARRDRRVRAFSVRGYVQAALRVADYERDEEGALVATVPLPIVKRQQLEVSRCPPQGLSHASPDPLTWPG